MASTRIIPLVARPMATGVRNGSSTEFLSELDPGITFTTCIRNSIGVITTWAGLIVSTNANFAITACSAMTADATSATMIADSVESTVASVKAVVTSAEATTNSAERIAGFMATTAAVKDEAME